MEVMADEGRDGLGIMMMMRAVKLFCCRSVFLVGLAVCLGARAKTSQILARADAMCRQDTQRHVQLWRRRLRRHCLSLLRTYMLRQMLCVSQLGAMPLSSQCSRHLNYSPLTRAPFLMPSSALIATDPSPPCSFRRSSSTRPCLTPQIVI